MRGVFKMPNYGKITVIFTTKKEAILFEKLQEVSRLKGCEQAKLMKMYAEYEVNRDLRMFTHPDSMFAARVEEKISSWKMREDEFKADGLD